jgi:hypothetical protein
MTPRGEAINLQDPTLRGKLTKVGVLMPICGCGIKHWPITTLFAHVSHAVSGTLVPSVVGGLIGGATVLVGVLVAEYLTRKRERVNRFDDAYWNLHAQGKSVFNQARWGGLFDPTLFLVALGRLRSEARPPLPNAKAITREIDAILGRYISGVDRWKQGKGPFPDVIVIFGDDIDRLAKRPEKWWNV